jgi:hypothetical protein
MTKLWQAKSTGAPTKALTSQLSDDSFRLALTSKSVSFKSIAYPQGIPQGHEELRTPLECFRSN